MTAAAKQRLAAVVAILVAVGALAWLSWGNLGENLVYYWSPSEVVGNASKAAGATVRLGGLVVPGSFDAAKCDPGCTFRVTDGREEVTVVSEGLPPQMFREGQGVVVEGVYGEDGVFRTDRIMVKHSNEYQAPQEGEMPDVATLEVE